MKPMILSTLAFALLLGCDKPQPPAISLQEAAATGNLTAIQQHIAAGSNLNEREPTNGGTALIAAAAFGQTAAAKALMEGGASLNATNNDGSTALHTAAFLCRTEVVKALLAAGADKTIRNNAGATALESVEAPFEMVKGIYDLIGTLLGPAGLTLDYDQIQAERPRIAELLKGNQP